VVDVETSDLSPPAPRRPRRKHRGLAFAVLFLIIVLIGLGAGAALFGVDSDDITGDKSGEVSSPGETTSTTTTVPPLPVPRPYKVTDGVNVRSGPGTSYSILATVETGHEVSVVCAIDGEVVDGPLGPTNKWLRIQLNAFTGYVTAGYVATGGAISDPAVLGTCPSI
jgi:uncharacterized protein YgiM (DUF1202 family)